MKSKSSNDKKPWENISLDEIQPYPVRYNKIIITAYLFVFSVFLIKYISINDGIHALNPFIKLIINGIFAFVVLKLVLRPLGHTSPSILAFTLPVYTIVIVLVSSVVLLFSGVSVNYFLNYMFTPLRIIYLTAWYFSVFFGLMAFSSVVYLSMSEYPKIKIHGYILAALFFFIYFIAGTFIQL